MGNKIVKENYLIIFKCMQGDEWYEAGMICRNKPVDEDINLFIEEVKKELSYVL